eukprot:COSAG06_NODE_4977_length_3815_cov_2.324004_4_plen_142_part_00
MEQSAASCVAYQSKHAETDVTQDNYIDTSGTLTGNSVLLVINSATKVKHRVTINVPKDCPVLAELLKSITINPKTLISGFPKYVLFQYSWRQRKHFGQQLSDPSTFNTRCLTKWEECRARQPRPSPHHVAVPVRRHHGVLA